jgi:hypothetical protein
MPRDELDEDTTSFQEACWKLFAYHLENLICCYKHWNPSWKNCNFQSVCGLYLNLSTMDIQRRALWLDWIYGAKTKCGQHLASFGFEWILGLNTKMLVFYVIVHYTIDMFVYLFICTCFVHLPHKVNYLFECFTTVFLTVLYMCVTVNAVVIPTTFL